MSDGSGNLDDSDLAEIIENLRVFGSDVFDVEAKRAEKALPRSVRETLSAFANTTGGTLILGLDESQNFAATGIENAAKMAADLASTCATEMEPPLRPLIRQHTFEGVQLVVAEVPELALGEKPCFYRGAGMNRGSYVRVNDGDHQLTSYEVQMMLAGRGQPRDDEQPVAGTSLADLDETMVRQFIDRLRTTRPYAFADLDDTDVLRRSKVLVRGDTGADECLSLGGLLALGRYPQQHFPQLMLTFVHYPTTSGGDPKSGERFLDNVSLEGPIPVMVKDAMGAMRRNMTRRSIVSGYGRADVWEYPETALREALVNALVHRDLSAASMGTQVQIEMYPDRLTIRNPGGLFGPVSVMNLGEEGVSSSRNASLLKILEDVSVPGETRTVCENRGSGIRAMIDALRDARMTLPKFENKISNFSVTFPNHTLMSDEVLSWLGALGEDGMTDSQMVGLAMLRAGEELDNLTYRSTTGLDSRQATVELQDLVARELVTQQGTRRWARYRLNPRVKTDAAQQSPRRQSPADRRTEILSALGDNVLSRSEIATRTGLNDQIVRRWLRTLREEGKVEIHGGGRPQSKNTRYKCVDQQPAIFGDEALFDGIP